MVLHYVAHGVLRKEYEALSLQNTGELLRNSILVRHACASGFMITLVQRRDTRILLAASGI